MNRARSVFAATLVVVSATVVVAQTTTQAPPLQSVLAGKKFIPPARGEVTIEHTPPITRRDGDNVVTTITVKNLATAPVARLTLTDTWYDGSGAIVTNGRGTINGLLQPGEVATIKVQSPYNAKMKNNRPVLTHANGTVKAALVKKLEVPKPTTAGAQAATTAKQPAAKPAATKK